jgi:hypothetical protein
MFEGPYTFDSHPRPESYSEYIHSPCWQVARMGDLTDKDPTFFIEEDVKTFAHACSCEEEDIIFGVWYFPNGLFGTTLPTLTYFYHDGEEFRRTQ